MVSQDKCASKTLQSETVKVLVADDHELTRFTLKLAVKRQPHIQLVALAINGQEAVEMTRCYTPDVVILDLQMPVLDGAKASRAIKAIAPQTKVIAYTSLQGQALDTYLQQGHFDDCVDKAADTQALLEAIVQVCYH